MDQAIEDRLSAIESALHRLNARVEELEDQLALASEELSPPGGSQTQGVSVPADAPARGPDQTISPLGIASTARVGQQHQTQRS